MGVMQSAHPLIVYLAAPRGFCAGVDRAIEIVEQALKLYGPPIYVRHEIVHNRWVVEDLRSKGVVFVKFPLAALPFFRPTALPKKWKLRQNCVIYR